ncbi:BTAD domain-containing putative transcriptional regulator [Actinoplanes sp. Pm04-4]|uniref:BTAD domain-containing putative transcriptional regulator n=1 Tax=Paractinoplanes pyxinae TaxID=2997416 RepID=A0ABT4ATN1_9ACTN|nr:BTAD domain-containing putative transcriptional regulator [Actinoplanes pyxinae]MCY1137035.1 BTAD domain-containing putative transcriptional regulator [Actinoplanes pyxinae]
MEGTVWLGILGPVRARRGDAEVDLRQRQLRHVLGLLLVRAGRPVATGEFLTLLWGDDPPVRAENIVHRHISNVRRLLEPDLPFRAQGRWVRRSAPGYELTAGPESLDLLEFRRLAAEGAASGDALEARMAALRLWRGRCGAGLDLPPSLVPEFTAVERERVAVLTAAVDDALACGRASSLLPVAQEAAEQDPLDEALQARLILLLAATGRQAAAVAAYHAVRTRLVEELGVDPGPELREAYDRVLRQDVAAAAPARVVPAQLPPRNRFFAGRTAELARLTAFAGELDRQPAATVIGIVDGLPGVGKTSLVTEWAHRVAGRFPDGQLFLNLRGFDPAQRPVASGQALTQLLAGLGVPAAQMPEDVGELTALFRTMTADRRLLIVLDNASDEDQVRPLLPASPGALVLITSRNRLTGLVVGEGAVPLSLAVPSFAEARAGLRDRLGAERIAGEGAALDEIVQHCGRLPLALAVVSARALAYPEWTLGAIAHELRTAPPLDFFDGEEPRSDVRNVFSWSYRLLSDRAARLFRLLPAHPGPDFGAITTAELAALPLHTTRQVLRELTRTSLLAEIRPGRWSYHDLIKAYAGCLDDESRAEAQQRLLDHLLSVGDRANRALRPAIRFSEAPAEASEPPMDLREALAWFTGELGVLEAASDLPGVRSWRLAEILTPYYQRRGLYQRWEATATRALDRAVAAGDLEGQAAMHRMLAGANAVSGRSRAAVAADADQIGVAAAHLDETLRILTELGRTAELAEVYRNRGVVEAEVDHHERALSFFEQALALFESGGSARGTSLTLLGTGWERAEVGDVEAGMADLVRAGRIAVELGDVHSAAVAAGTHAHLLARLGRVDEAVGRLDQAAELFRRIEDEDGMAGTEVKRGDLLAEAGRPVEAATFWRRARNRYADLGQVSMAEAMDKRLSSI